MGNEASHMFLRTPEELCLRQSSLDDSDIKDKLSNHYNTSRGILYSNICSDFLIILLLQAVGDNNGSVDFGAYEIPSGFVGDIATQSELVEVLKKFELLMQAGVKVGQVEALDACRQRLLLQRPSSLAASPFAVAFQLRLAAMRGLEGCLASEISRSRERFRRLRTADSTLGVQTHPEYALIAGLLDSGAALLGMCPVLYKHHSQGAGTTRESLGLRAMVLDPVRRLCDRLQQLPSRSLFGSWGSRPAPAYRTLSLHSPKSGLLASTVATTVNEVAGATNPLSDGKPCWTSQGAVGCWSVRILGADTGIDTAAGAESVVGNASADGATVHALRVSWCPNGNGSFHAPKKLQVRMLVRTAARAESSACARAVVSADVSDELMLVLSIDIDRELQGGGRFSVHDVRGGNGCHVYRLLSPVPGVVGVELLCSGCMAGNWADCVQISRFEALTMVPDEPWFDSLPLLCTIQQHLYPLLGEVIPLEGNLTGALLGILGASGSLQQILDLIQFLLGVSSEGPETRPASPDSHSVLPKDSDDEFDDLSDNCGGRGGGGGVGNSRDRRLVELCPVPLRQLLLAIRAQYKASLQRAKDDVFILKEDLLLKSKERRWRNRVVLFTLPSAEEIDETDCLGGPGSGHTCCLALLHELSRLAQLYGSFPRVIPGYVDDLPLAALFCLQVSPTVLQQLVVLVEGLCFRMSETLPGTPSTREFETMLEGILNILDLQLTVLGASEVDPLEVENEAGCDAVGFGDVATAASRALRSIIYSQDAALSVRLVAAGAFGRGVALLVPDLGDRLRLVCDLFETVGGCSVGAHGDCKDGTSALAEVDSAQFLLLTLLMENFSMPRSVQQLVALALGKSAKGETVRVFISRVFSAVSEQTKCGLTEASQARAFVPSSSFQCALDDACIKVLQKCCEQLVFRISTGSPVPSISSTGTAVDASGGQLSAVVSFLLHIVSTACTHSSGILLHYGQLLQGCGGSDSLVATLSLRTGHILRASLVGRVHLPLLHSLCLCSHNCAVVTGVLPLLIEQSRLIKQICDNSPSCQLAEAVLGKSLCAADLLVAFAEEPSSSDISADGWRVIPHAVFEQDDSYTLDDGGRTYASTTSTNGCGLVNICFNETQKAAWEFQLVADTAGDECSIFGAARKPLHNRCYSSSPDMWMRRGYNGYMYSNGRSSGESLGKIHPGDTVRIQYDGQAATLSYSVNGGEVVVGFTSVSGGIYPACGSYRTGVHIKLLKVEVFPGKAATSSVSVSLSPVKLHWKFPLDACLDEAPMPQRPPVVKDSAVLSIGDAEAKGVITARGDGGVTEGVHEFVFQIEKRTSSGPHLEDFVDLQEVQGLAFGVFCSHCSSVTQLPFSDTILGARAEEDGVSLQSDNTASRSISAIDVVVEKEEEVVVFVRPSSVPFANGDMARASSCPILAVSHDDTEETEDGEQADDDFSAVIGTEGDLDDFPVPPSIGMLSRAGNVRDEAAAVTAREELQTRHRSASLTALMAVPRAQVDDDKRRVSFSGAPTRRHSRVGAVASGCEDPTGAQSVSESCPYLRERVSAFSWHAHDGSLWVNGVQRSGLLAEQRFPSLKVAAPVTVQINLEVGTISYFVNGDFIGVAFGAAGSGAVVTLSEAELKLFARGYRCLEGPSHAAIVYPAASTSVAHSIRLQAGGFAGSSLLPVELRMRKTLLSTASRLVATLIAGPPVIEVELEALSWLKSPLLSSGLADTDVDAELADERALLDELVVWRGQQGQAQGQSARLLLQWLEGIESDSAALRLLFNKSDSFSFPALEGPYVACLLVHSGLVREAVVAVGILRSSGIDLFAEAGGTDGGSDGGGYSDEWTVCDVDPQSTAIATEVVVPSADIVALWRKVRQLRTFLRQERQRLRSAGSLREDSLAPVPEYSTSPAFFMSSAINWRRPMGSCKSYCTSRPSCCCDILLVGVDTREHAVVYVLFCVSGADEAGAPDVKPGDSSLHVRGTKLVNPVVLQEGLLTVSDQRCLRFDLSPLAGRGSAEWEFPGTATFSYGLGGFSDTVICIPIPKGVGEQRAGSSLPCSVPDCESEGLSPFSELCARLESRAKFLARFCSAEASTFARVASPGVDRVPSSMLLPSSPSLEWRRQLSESNSNIIGELGSGSSLTRPSSTAALDSLRGEYSGANSDVPPVEMTQAQQAINLCASFLLGGFDEPKGISVPRIEDMLALRRARAEQRMQGLDAARALLKLHSPPQACLNSSASAFNVHHALEATELVGLVDLALSDRSAVFAGPGGLLKDLEGCAEHLMRPVTENMLALQHTVGDVLARVFSQWQCAKNLRDNTAAFPPLSRAADLLHATLSLSQHGIDAGPGKLALPFTESAMSTLHDMVSFESFEACASEHAAACLQLTDFLRLHQAEVDLFSALLEDGANYLSAGAEKDLVDSVALLHTQNPQCGGGALQWRCWSSKFVRSGLKSGELSCRSVVMHLLQVPSTELSDHLKAELGLDKDYLDILSGHDCSRISLLHEQVSSLIHTKEEVKELALNMLMEVREGAARKHEMEELVRLDALGAVYFDANLKADDIVLSKCNYEAEILASRVKSTVSSVLATVVYDANDPADMRGTGNYFEVEILKSGVMNDVGIGLAVRNRFVVSTQMPGWTEHSYGYHGDDGRKFGTGDSMGTWPLYSSGDVVGCGFDSNRQTIFFTLNGILLGDGFLDVRDTRLCPVIGMHGIHSHQKVRINFGSIPFRYDGPEVIVNAAALADRQHGSEADAVALSGLDDSPFPADIVERMVAKVSGAGLLAGAAAGVMPAAEKPAYLEGVSPSPVILLASYKEYISLRSQVVLSGMRVRQLERLRGHATALLAKIGQTACTSADGSAPLRLLGSTIAAVLSQGSARLRDSEEPRAQHTRLATLSVMKTRLHCKGPSSSSSADKLVFTEPLEAERVVHEVLSVLCSFADNALALGCCLEDPVIRRQVEAALLVIATLIQFPRCQRLAAGILRLWLPTMIPDEVESAVSPLRLVGAEEARPAAVGVGGTRRRMPDTLVRIMMHTIIEALQVPQAVAEGRGNKKWSNPESVVVSLEAFRGAGLVPVGVGECLLAAADGCASTLAAMLAAPLWTELIACTLTDALRTAGRVLSEPLCEKPLSAEAERSLLAACAACAVLTGVGVLRPGCRVNISAAGGQETTFLGFTGTCRQTAWVLVDDTEDILERVVAVPLGDVSVAASCTSVDLSVLTQPLIAQLVDAFRAVCGQQLRLKGQRGRYHRLLLRVGASVCECVSVLLGSDSVGTVHALQEQLQDAGLLQDVAQCALATIPLEFIPDKALARAHWSFMQARGLESQLPAASAEQESIDNSNANDGMDSGHQVDSGDKCNSGSGDVLQPMSPLGGGDAVDICFETRKRGSVRYAAVDRLHAATGKSWHECLMLLEYHMLDEAAARAALMDSSGAGDATTLLEAPAGVEAVLLSQRLTQAVEFSVDNPCGFVGTELVGPLPAGVPAAGRSGEEVSPEDWYERCGATRRSSYNLMLASRVPDLWRKREESLGTADHRPGCYVVLDADPAAVTEESKDRAGEVLALCMSGPLTTQVTHVIVSEYDDSLGTAFMSCHRFSASAAAATGTSDRRANINNRSSVNFVDSLCGHQVLASDNIDTIATGVAVIDEAVAILSVRSIFASLLEAGRLNVRSDVRQLTDWVGLVKLLSGVSAVPATNDRSAQDISMLLAKLLGRAKTMDMFAESAAVSGDGESGAEPPGSKPKGVHDQLALMVIKDVHRGLQLLLDVSLACNLAETVMSYEHDKGSPSSDMILPTVNSYGDFKSVLVGRTAGASTVRSAGKLRFSSSCRAVITSSYRQGTEAGTQRFKIYDSLGSVAINSPVVSLLSGSDKADSTMVSISRHEARQQGEQGDSNWTLMYEFVEGGEDEAADDLPKRRRSRADGVPPPGPSLPSQKALLKLMESIVPAASLPDAIDGKPYRVEKYATAKPALGLGSSKPDNLHLSWIVASGAASINSVGSWYFEITVEEVADCGTDVCDVIGLVCSVAPPGKILGSSPLSVGLSSAGDLSCEGRRAGSIDKWRSGDTVGCLFRLCAPDTSLTGLLQISVDFHVSGKWSNSCVLIVPRANADSPLPDLVSVKPAWQTSSSTKYTFNAGEKPFAFNAAVDSFHAASLGWRPFCELYAPSLVGSVATAPPVTTPPAPLPTQHLLAPIYHLPFAVAREFALIWSAMDGSVESPGEGGVHIWRPKTIPGFAAMGDVVTTSSERPFGTVLVDAGHCAYPLGFARVFSHYRQGLALWRPLPPPGFVAMGDVASLSSSVGSEPATEPPTSSCVCVPLWAVTRCCMAGRIAHLKKHNASGPISQLSHACSLWAVENSLDTFYGSPCSEAQLVALTKLPEDADVNGVSNCGYRLTHARSTACMVTGRWATERDVCRLPSLSWCCAVIEFVLDCPLLRPKVLQPTLFVTLLDYLCCAPAVTPLYVIPLLIKMIRLSYENSSSGGRVMAAGAGMLEGISKAVMATATSKTYADRGALLPYRLVSLVDLVVEVQLTHVAAKSRRVCQKLEIIRSEGSGNGDNVVVTRKLLNKTKLASSLDPRAVEKVSSETAIDLPAPMETSSGSSASVEMATATIASPLDNIEPRWATCRYEHAAVGILGSIPALAQLSPLASLSEEAKEEARLVARKRLDHVFGRDPALQRLRNVIKCLVALGASPVVQHKLCSIFFPTLMIARLWFNHLSLVEFVQGCGQDLSRNLPMCERGTESTSSWESKTGTTVTVTTRREDAYFHRHLVEEKRVSFPGAARLNVILDPRCCIGEQATLTLLPIISSGGRELTPVVLHGTGGQTHSPRQHMWSKHFSLLGDEVVLRYEHHNRIRASGDLADSGTLEALSEGLWGWAVMVRAFGTVYEQYALEVRLPPEGPPCEIMPPTRRRSSTKGRDSRSASLGAIEQAFGDGGDSSSAAALSKLFENLRGSSPAVEEEADPQTELRRAVVEKGKLVASGEVLIPHATDLELTIDRCCRGATLEPAPANMEAVCVVSLTPVTHRMTSSRPPGKTAAASSGKPSTHRVEPDTTVSVICNGCSAVQYKVHIALVPAPTNDSASPARGSSPKSMSCDPPKPSNMTADLDPDSAMAAARFHNTIHGNTSGSSPAVPRVLPPYSEPTTSLSLPTARTAGNEQNSVLASLIRDMRVRVRGRGGSGGWAGGELGDGGEEEEDSEEGSDGGEEEEYSAAEEDPAGAGAPVPKVTSAHSPLKPTAAKDQVADGDVIKISARGVMSMSQKFETRIDGAIAAGRATPCEVMKRMGKWTAEADIALLEFLNAQQMPVCNILMKPSPSNAIPKTLFSNKGLVQAGIDLMDIHCRILVIEALNSALMSLLPLVNIANTDPLSLGCMLRQCNKYVLAEVKEPLLTKTISSTMPTPGPGLPAQVGLSNFKALASVDKGAVTVGTSECCFVQAFRQLHYKPVDTLRFIFGGDRVFHITYEGEAGIDAGGVFRDGVSAIAEDLFSDRFDLFTLCPNGKHVVHTNMDKFVPNAAYCSAQHGTRMGRVPGSTPGADPIEMFEFVGKLVAMSIRAKLCIPFEFPALIWKKIVGETVLVDDLVGIDAIGCRLLSAVRFCERDGITTEEQFNERFHSSQYSLSSSSTSSSSSSSASASASLRFTYTTFDGVERELFPGSRERTVTFDNRVQYYEAVLRAKLGEFDAPVQAMVRGMDAVLPMRALLLYSWDQLETVACGSPAVDIELWKSKTDTRGILVPRTAALFWRVIESFSPKEQAGFIRFAWGRSRLPAAKDFKVPMKLHSTGKAVKLPVSHTCFFSVELPDYETEEEMRHGLLTAIQYGIGGILMS